MAVDADTHYRLLAEIANCVDPADSAVPSSPEVDALRETLTRQVAQNLKDGYDVEVPHELA